MPSFFKRLVRSAKRSLNPVKAVRHEHKRLKSRIGDPLGKKRTKRKEKARAEGRQAQFAKEEASFKAIQQKKRDRLAREGSERVRGSKGRGSRRSLLTGDERGVDVEGRRKTTG